MLKQWSTLCSEISNSKWKKADVKNDLKISRQSFKDTDVASFKVHSHVCLVSIVFHQHQIQKTPPARLPINERQFCAS